ncbi:GDSL esterase/lipase At2g42990-like isoform X2 [Cicer arietinum]|uniref:GDSL esterase/lipase At2g42990-like isoform X2 n=1 Tax=Cicer arietinum TaxID=3827 RepID=UPI003CC56F49
MRTKYTLFLFFIELVVHFSISNSGKVPAIIVFGDSSVDSGNNNFIPTIAKSNFEPYGRDFPNGNPTGRFSNGRIPSDFISEAFGLKSIVPAYLDPSYDIYDFATGVCFASAGTGYDNATSNVADVIPLWKEVEFYKDYQKKLRACLGDEKANEIVKEALYLVSIGTNDFLENYYTLPDRRAQFTTVQKYEDFLIGLAENFLRKIYDLGARKISLTGLPPMGCLPLERALNIMDLHGCVDEYNDVALEFNAKLGRLVTKLNKKLPGFQLVDANGYNILLQIVTQPSHFVSGT